MKKQIKIIFIIIISIFISLPLIFLNLKNDVISEIDNRKLTELPRKPSLNSTYLNNLTTYFDDRYGGREFLISNYTKFNDLLFDELIHPTYTYGKDGHIFFRMGKEIKYNNYHSNFLKSIVKIKNYVESKGAKFYVMINSEKTSVYTQYIPKGVNYNRDWIEKFEGGLIQNNVNFIDNTNELKLRSNYEFVYDKKYDAGHWNDLGAFYGVNNLLRKINKDFQNVKELSKEDFNISKKLNTTLKVSKFPIYEYSPLFILKNADKYEDLTKNYEDIIINEHYHYFKYIKNNLENNFKLPKVLVFQGSYLNGREKYLQSRFSEYIAVHNYQNIFNIEYYFEKFSPDIVIFEVAEYTFNDNYFSIENIEKFIEKE